MIHVNLCKGGRLACIEAVRWSRHFQITGIAMTRILQADEDVEIRAMLSEYLQAEGFVVDAVHDGETAFVRAGGRL